MVRQIGITAVMIFVCLGICVGQEFVTIPAQSFDIEDGITGNPVTVSVSEYQIATTEVTQQQYSEIMGSNPSYHQGDTLPVENIRWWDAIRYCNLRSQNEGLQGCYDLATGQCDFSKTGYRLPTSTEWTLAAGSVLKMDEAAANKIGNMGRMNKKNIPQLMEDLKGKATMPVGSFPANEHGLYDMLGNVWEWCYDYFTPEKDYYVPLRNPEGPPWGVAREVRGGSFLSPVWGWTQGSNYRFSKEPDYKSRFTGFRLCRSTDNRNLPDFGYGTQEWFAKYHNVPEKYQDTIGALSNPLDDGQGNLITCTADWEKKHEQIRQKWIGLLGTPPIEKPPVNVKLVKTIDDDIYTGHIQYLQTEPDHWEKIFVMIPKHPACSPTPVVIVPYYDIDTPAGKAMGGSRSDPPGVRSFAYQMVQQGFVAIAVKYYEIGYGEGLAEAVANLKLKYPDWSGLGKWVWDAQRVVDYIYTLPYVDHNKIGVIGHSLGGKQALYAAAFDGRITVCVSSELGIGLSYSNYDDYWYFGDYIKNVGPETDQHELIALIAPRPFMLIGGDKYDPDEAWTYINAAKKVYDLYGCGDNIGMFNHHTGHSPTPEAIQLATQWLVLFLNP